MPGEVPPAIAVGMDRQFAMPPEFDHADQPDRVEACHDAGAAEVADEIVAVAHLIEIAGEVEGDHHFLAGAVCMIVDHLHYRTGPLVERADRAIGIQFVVLDEVDAGFGEAANQGRRFLGAEPDARLDDRAYQRPAVDIGETPGSFYPETGTRIGRRKGSRKAEIDEAKAGELPELEEIAGDGRHQVGERRTEIVERP